MEGWKILDKACREEKVKMIGLYCDYENVTENIFLSKYIKDNFQLPVIVGGPQSTALDIDFLLQAQCDAIVRYEGEITVLELMDFFLENIGKIEKILGIAYLNDNKIIVNKDRFPIQNLDDIPIVGDECYLIPESKFPGLSIMTGRGCPFNCAFCHEGHHTRQVRFRTVENVMQEIDVYLQKELEIPFIMFVDDTFTLQPERVKRLCAELAKRRERRELYWFCEGHVRTLYQHPEMIKYIADGGGCRIQLGIESGTQQVLDAYRKNTTVEEIKQVVKWCVDAGLEVYGNIILAGALYNKSVYEENLAFAKELLNIGEGRVELGVVSFWPLPNTSMTKRPEDYGLKIIDHDFITSLGDFPQIETREYSKWDICQQMKDMESSLREHMKYMLENWSVPTSYIKRWFGLRDKNISLGLWYRFLKENTVLFSYYSFLYSGEAVSSIELKNNIQDAHPMRVTEIYNKIRKINEDEFEFCDCVLSSVESNILLLTTGKLSVKEIVKCLRYYGMKVDHQEVISTLLKLEKHHLLVWSKY